ncbi:nucleoside monophosphate kinase [Candidatus Microgenomates bacterium]|nr:nucleoside monophosphate kinase [Candidatus Microgenomates bacterium]
MKDTSDNSKPKRIIVMGPVGSGKSTQAQLLAKYFNLPHLDMGAKLRALSKTHKEIVRALKVGKLVTDSLTLRIMEEEIGRPSYQRGFVLDGAPRRISQARKLPFIPDVVIYLKVSDNVTIERLLLRGRADDTQEVIARRLAIYHNQTSPVLAFFSREGKLLEIDGEPPIDVIFQDILHQLKTYPNF